ncbi:MAG: glycoside hydrolase family 97 protein [Clostridium sp.]|nr:glycoside hydrolase family 97 protein [Bacteroides sp.]MCM1197738.1 glycoside hydrolase family 97 protein [Clostridium sp.]
MPKIKTIGTFAFCLLLASCAKAPEYMTLTSPDSRICVKIDTADTLRYSVTLDGKSIVMPSAISMELQDGRMLGVNPGKYRIRKGRQSETVLSPFHRQESITAEWSYADIGFGDWSLALRVYDYGLAWRFETSFKDSIMVKDETAQFIFPDDPMAWVPYSRGNDPFANAFQSEYTHEKVSEFNPETALSLIPLAVQMEEGTSMLICESAQLSYPGMFLRGIEGGYQAEFPCLPDSVWYTSVRHQKKIATRKDIIAKTCGTRSFPWRIMAIAREDRELPVNNLVYLLAEPRRHDDISWIKPGQVAWEWWNDYGLDDVGFKPGINTATYREYIDFASEYGIPYIIIDEGWSDKKDIMSVKPDVDLPGLVSYASSRNVGIIVWAVANVLYDKLEEACVYYSGIGVKGFKIDFFDRDDQESIDMIYDIAETTQRHHLIVDLHGVNKPAGLNRTFPHLVNFEGVFGLEEVKWSNPDMPLYDVTFPFLRQVQGPVDYTQGAFRNATRDGFRIDYSKPMSQGTRTHQTAAYIVFDSPLAMLCDTPSLYKAEPECTGFITSIPTVFSQTEIPAGKIGEYIVTAREKDGTWYVGALNNWNEKTLKIPLCFLPEGKEFKAVHMSDYSSEEPQKYVIEEYTVIHDSIIELRLASGGGAALIITEKQ